MIAPVEFIVEDGFSMSKKQNDEPRDEFDHVMLPAFLEKPISYINNQGPLRYPAPTGDDQPSAQYSDDESMPDERPERGAPQQQGPRKWYAGARGKTLIYGAGMVLMAVLQFRN
jgi:hypothetical protein